MSDIGLRIKSVKSFKKVYLIYLKRVEDSKKEKKNKIIHIYFLTESIDRYTNWKNKFNASSTIFYLFIFVNKETLGK